jgi:hypothetical protein
MGRTDDYGHARLADGHCAGAMDDGQTIHLEAFRHLVGDRLEHPPGELFECLVVETEDRLAGMASRLALFAGRRAAGRVAGDPQERHDGAHVGMRHRAAQAGQERLVERVRGQLEAPDRLDRSPARYGWDDRDLVAIGEGRLRLRVLPIPCEAHVRPPGSKHREAADQVAPCVLDRRARHEGKLDLAPPGKLALDREETRADGQARLRSRLRHERTDARSRPSPTGRMVAFKRGWPRA